MPGPRHSRRAPDAAPNLRLLPRDFLLHQDKPVRRPLREWATELRRTLAEAQDAPDEAASAAAACFNQGALIAVFRGRLENAEALCRAHLDWVARRMTTTGNLFEARLAIQPWINLGRLARIRGDHDQTAQFFCLRDLPIANGSVRLGPVVIPGGVWQRLRDDTPEIRDLLVTVQWLETLKTFLAVRDYDRTLRCARKGACSADELRPYLDEAVVMALTALGRLDEAAETVQHADVAATLPVQMVWEVYHCTLLIARGRGPDAAGRLRRLAAFFSPGLLLDSPDPSTLHLAAHLAKLLEAAGDRDAALDLYGRGYAGARSVCDEAWSMALLEQMVRLSSGAHQQPQWERELRDLQRLTLYVSPGDAVPSRADEPEELRMLWTDLSCAMAQ